MSGTTPSTHTHNLHTSDTVIFSHCLTANGNALGSGSVSVASGATLAMPPAALSNVAFHWSGYYNHVYDVTGTVGVVPNGHWTNLPGQNWTMSAGNTNLVDSNGAASTMAVTSVVAGGGTYWQDYFGGTPANNLIKGPGGGSGNIENKITGITYTSYEIIAYVNGAQAGNAEVFLNPTYAPGSPAYYYSPTCGSTENLVQVTNTTPGTYPAGNYVVFTGLSGSTQIIEMAQLNGLANDGIDGFQVVDTTPPTLTLNTLTGSGTLDVGNLDVAIIGGSNANSTFSGSIIDVGSISKVGSGTLTLTGSSNYTGTTTIQAGTIQLGTNNALPVTTKLILGAASTNGTLDLAGFNQSVAGLAVASGASPSSQIIANSSTSNNSTLTFNGSSSTFAGTIQDHLPGPVGTQTVALIVNAGTLTLTGANSYSGGTTITSGILNAASNSNLGSGSLTLNGGTLQFAAAFDPTSARIVSLGSSGGTFDTNSNSISLANSISGSGALTKAGFGTLTLAPTNAYSGGTIISGGTLAVSADSNLGSSPNLTINNASLDVNSGYASSLAITLGTGSPTIQVDSGTLSLTNLLTGSGSLTKAGSGVLQLAYNAAANNSLQTLAGLTMSSGSIDLTNHDLLITHGASAGVTRFLGDVLTSTTVPSANGGTANALIAWVSGADYNTVTGTSTLNSDDLYGKFTYAGDANLDGLITTDDYVALDMGFLFGLSGWVNGDFIQSGGFITPLSAIGDYAAIDNSFQHQSGPLADGEIALHESWFGQAYTDAFNALNAPASVPEPASLALLAAASLTLLRRKRK